MERLVIGRRPQKSSATGRHSRWRPSDVSPLAGATQLAEAVLEPTTNQREASVGDRRLGALLIARGLMSEADLEVALRRQLDSGGRLGEVLVDLGVIAERQLVVSLAEQSGLALADLHREQPDPEALRALPEALLRTHLAVPLRFDGEVLVVAVDEPNEELLSLLRNAAGRPVRLEIAPASEIRRVIDHSYSALVGLDGLVHAFEQTDTSRARTAESTSDDKAQADAPIVRITNRILTQALRERASDIHIEPQDEVVRVRFRIDGVLKEIARLPFAAGPALVSRIKVLAGMNIVERRLPQDGQFTYDLDGKHVDVRVATVAGIWGEKCVMRVLDKTRAARRLGELGMPMATHEQFSKLIRAPFGMVLCAGPTGSGKTTTLYASLTEINDPSRNLMTIEDPVEYVFPSINQIQVNTAAGLTFANGLRSILRQDPDAILVGEIRDVETARIAVQSALTGHFVLSSLHATDAVSALHRFLDMGIESFLVASSVLAIVGQRLVRRICSSCKVPYSPSDEERSFYEERGGPAKSVFYRGAGCNFCAGTGYEGRIGIYELLHMTPEIKRLVVGWATQEELRRLAQAQGMRTLRDEAISLIARDVTTPSEVIRTIYGL